MHRLANFDVSRQFLARRSKVAAQIVFGGMCAAAMIGVRSLIDVWAPVSGPFALIYPTVLLATLYGHWRAGVVALAVTFCWAWFFILPPARSFLFADPTDPVRVLLNAASAVVVVVFAEAFRRAAQAPLSEIRDRAARRLTLLAALGHRTKNNFALVASLLEEARRRAYEKRTGKPAPPRKVQFAESGDWSESWHELAEDRAAQYPEDAPPPPADAPAAAPAPAAELSEDGKAFRAALAEKARKLAEEKAERVRGPACATRRDRRGYESNQSRAGANQSRGGGEGGREGGG